MFKQKLVNVLKRKLTQSPGVDFDKYQVMFKRQNVKSPFDSTTATITSTLLTWDNVIESRDMQQLIETFSTFDPINDFSKYCTLANCTRENHIADDIIDEQEINGSYCKNFDECGSVIVSYLKHSNFNETLLSNKTWDPVTFAITTYLLSCSIKTLLWIKINYPEFSEFIIAIYEAKNNEYNYIMTINNRSWVYTRAPFKILAKHFTQRKFIEPEIFSLLEYLDSEFLHELQSLHTLLLTNKIDETFTMFLESYKPIPYNIEHIIGKYDEILGKSNIRYFTGEACCGKTTLVPKLDFEAKSRGSIGGFSSKHNNMASVSCLHFSIDFALNQYKSTIGDRGNIDNTLWLWIMNHCDVLHQQSLVSDLLQFISCNFNAATLAYFMRQNVVVFIDTQPDLNSERMLQRGTGGDSTRGRIKYYPHVQTLAYYTVARLFGWRVFCVPYIYSKTSKPIFNPQKYDDIAKEINAVFSKNTAFDSEQMPVNVFNKTSNTYVLDNVYSKSVGIYK